MNEKILFITATRIGDAVLSNGILAHLLARYPSARVTVACGPLVAEFYEGVPQIEQIVALKKKSWKRHWLKLWAGVIGTRWDIVVDLRNSAVSRLVCVKERYVFGPHIDQTRHKAVQNANVIGLSEAPDTRLWLSAAQKEKALGIVPEGLPVLGIGPTSNWIAKTWAIGNFIELVARLIASDGPFHGWRVAVFSGAGEEPLALKLLQSLPDGVGIDVISKGNPAEAAACLARCGFYIGNDSGLMHTAAAAGVPTLGLFGPTYPEIYGPFGPKAAYIRTPETVEELIGYEGYSPKTVGKSLMDGLSVDAVYKAAEALFLSSSGR